MATAEFQVSSIPLELWIWGAVTLLMTAAIGFSAGIFYARMSAEWAIQRAGKHLAKLFQVVLDSLESAQKACLLLEQFPNLILDSEQTERLDRKRNRLLETVSKIVDSQRHLQQAAREEPPPKQLFEELTIEWQRTPEDPETGLPDRTAFESNLQSLLEIGQQTGQESGLLLVRVDKYDHLAARFGADGARKFLRKIIGLVCRAIREEDLICRFNTDTLAVFFPGVDCETGKKLAEVIRNTVRQHRFRLDEAGPEVLVTASFGYTPCLPEDNSELIADRAGDALSKSMRRGRNQLHVHDGNLLVHCAVG